ncbi:MAG: DPP IV N-terminal domain-containing protein [Chloroflexi bacterium]|nr:DPP IV N-terminal domain-containing protein [Chloroflexota bacterium]MDA8187545.1 DPP IV N-terminal domain-containing protein [Dehalococcoidales bacterium]
MRLPLLAFLFIALALTAGGCGTFRVDAGFKQPAELTATAEAKATRPSPTPIPKLGKLAFMKGGDIWVKDLPDGQAIRLTHDGHNDTPTWSPSGEWLAFRKGTAAAGRYQLWIVRASGTDARSIDIVRSGMSQQMAWSPVEDRLAYVSRNGLFVAETGGTKPRELVTPSSQEGFGVTSLAWSPDGRWIAFDKLERTDIRPSVQGLLRAKADGSEIKEVYLNPDPFQTQSYLAGWSPDGQVLLFWQGRQMSASMLAGGVPLMRVPVAGGAPVEITKAALAHGDFLAWASDAQKLALVIGNNRSTWYGKTIAVATLSGRLEALSDAGRADLFPAFSPNGQWIAFTSAPAVETDGGNDAAQASAQRRIWVMAPNGANKRQITNDPAYRDERPLWSADGSFILFVRFKGEQAQLWLMRADGSEQRQVVDEMTPSPESFGYYGYVDWGRLYEWWGRKTRVVEGPTPYPVR